MRRLIADELTDLGYQVIETNSGDDAVLASNSHERKIDLLLTDVILPGKSGRDAYEQIAAARPGLPVVYMSGHTEKYIVHRGVLDAGTHFLAKPFTDEQLAAKLREALDARKDATS